MPGQVGKTSSPAGTAETNPVFVRAATRQAQFSIVPAGLVCNIVRPRRSNAGLFSKCPSETMRFPTAQKLRCTHLAEVFCHLAYLLLRLISHPSGGGAGLEAAPEFLRQQAEENDEHL